MGVQALGGAVVGRADQRPRRDEPAGRVLQVGEGGDLPGDVVHAHGRPSGRRATGVRAELEQADVVVVGGVRCLQEGGPAGDRHRHPEVQDVGVEGGGTRDVTDVEDNVVEAVDAHDLLLGPFDTWALPGYHRVPRALSAVERRCVTSGDAPSSHRAAFC